jgi:hypothetical protein
MNIYINDEKLIFRGGSSNVSGAFPAHLKNHHDVLSRHSIRGEFAVNFVSSNLE